MVMVLRLMNPLPAVQANSPLPTIQCAADNRRILCANRCWLESVPSREHASASEVVEEPTLATGTVAEGSLTRPFRRTRNPLSRPSNDWEELEPIQIRRVTDSNPAGSGRDGNGRAPLAVRGRGAPY